MESNIELAIRMAMELNGDIEVDPEPEEKDPQPLFTVHEVRQFDAEHGLYRGGWGVRYNRGINPWWPYYYKTEQEAKGCADEATLLWLEGNEQILVYDFSNVRSYDAVREATE